MTDSHGGGATMVDAQFSIARVVRPIPDFESAYQGQFAGLPIAFPGSLDPRAGQTGFAPGLLKGIPMPLGARVKIWFPVCSTPDPEDPDTIVLEQDYKYRLIWRMRNVGDFRNPSPGEVRPPFHLATQGFGAPDGDESRFPIPAAYNVVGFEQPQVDFENGQVQLKVEEVAPFQMYSSPNLFFPIAPDAPDGIGIPMQGILDPDTAGLATNAPSFAVFDTEAQGDELIIYANRVEGPFVDWDFTDPDLDLPFSNIYGTGNGEHPVFRNSGIIIMTGSAP